MRLVTWEEMSAEAEKDEWGKEENQGGKIALILFYMKNKVSSLMRKKLGRKL